MMEWRSSSRPLRADRAARPATALLLGTYATARRRAAAAECLDELARLAETAGLEVAARSACLLRQLHPATLLGKGKLALLAAAAQDKGVAVVIFDDPLSPHQQRNLEQIFSLPVLDRSELILDIFAQRARSKEAKVQVELAKVEHQFPRLRHRWTHFSRQTGGGKGFTKGEGEQQIAIDRQLLRRKRVQLKKELAKIERQRAAQRTFRRRAQIPAFSLIGYTNAGKSTLLNALAAANARVEDRLFATLDTRVQQMVLPNRQPVLLVDTVGFIRKLPHLLVAAFRSTLEEVVHTDVLLHIVDACHPQAWQQIAATDALLAELQVDDYPLLMVLNKVDQLPDQSCLQPFYRRYPQAVAISAATGAGLKDLVQKMVSIRAALRQVVALSIPQHRYQLISDLLRQGHVRELKYRGNSVLLTIDLPLMLQKQVAPFVVPGEQMRC